MMTPFPSLDPGRHPGAVTLTTAFTQCLDSPGGRTATNVTCLEGGLSAIDRWRAPRRPPGGGSDVAVRRSVRRR